jgi:hypothetical protein
VVRQGEFFPLTMESNRAVIEESHRADARWKRITPTRIAEESYLGALKYSRDLTELARQGNSLPVIGPL